MMFSTTSGGHGDLHPALVFHSLRTSSDPPVLSGSGGASFEAPARAQMFFL